MATQIANVNISPHNYRNCVRNRFGENSQCCALAKFIDLTLTAITRAAGPFSSQQIGTIVQRPIARLWRPATAPVATRETAND